MLLAPSAPPPNKGRKDLGAQRTGIHTTQPPIAPSSSVKSRETGTIWSKETSSPVMAILRCVYRKRLRTGSTGEDRASRGGLGIHTPSLLPRAVLVVPSHAQSSCPLCPQCPTDCSFMNTSAKLICLLLGSPCFVSKTCA